MRRSWSSDQALYSGSREDNKNTLQANLLTYAYFNAFKCSHYVLADRAYLTKAYTSASPIRCFLTLRCALNKKRLKKEGFKE